MLHPSAQKVVEAARERGLEIDVLEFDEPTRTAEQAAEAIGCEVAQIVKSLCFVVDGRPIMALVSGANRLDVKKLAALSGVGKRKVKRADADTVKAATGYSIGGVPPLGHALPLYIDADLIAFETIWAAAGTPHAVFPIQPAVLQATTGGRVADLKQ